ncbi:PREDICTED: uncharacterized protein LOC108777143 [Cyphomyrmex costatus]|uniref:uncharacterized protein LOC108777143 n=1 Tax=Cyphomyrmex costatus TaxID=456900 RepID=UPI0008523C42|nr:PREDICTED: uncharacterized protein LOC108777143 [Cyphomyrmex costatus]
MHTGGGVRGRGVGHDVDSGFSLVTWPFGEQAGCWVAVLAVFVVPAGARYFGYRKDILSMIIPALDSNVVPKFLQVKDNLGTLLQIIVIPADKGNATVVMNTSDNRTKMESLLTDKTYTRLDRDLTNRIERKTSILLEKSGLHSKIKATLKPANSLPPRLYGLPKIHKPNIPLRPIISGAAMGSSISLVVANIFTEHFEEESLRKATSKSEIWYRYVDDIFVIWKHGKDELDKFLNFVNQHPIHLNTNIRFTMEIEENGMLPFLDVLVTKKTHWAIRAFSISDKEHLQTELNHLKETLQRNGYNEEDVNRIISKHRSGTKKSDTE